MDKRKEKLKMLEKAALKMFAVKKAEILDIAKKRLELNNWQLATLAKIIVVPDDLDRAIAWIKILTDFDPDRERQTLRVFRVDGAKISIVDFDTKHFNYMINVTKNSPAYKSNGRFARYKTDSHKKALSSALTGGKRLNLVFQRIGLLVNGKIDKKWDELIIID